MIKYCYDKWRDNCEKLLEKLKSDTNLSTCNYKYLVQLVVKYILNNGFDEDSWDLYEDGWSANKITEIDNGEYQGTLLFLIPKNCYQPSQTEYLMTYVNYGSCSYCDTLQSIQCGWNYDDAPEDWHYDDPPTEAQVKDFFILCRDLVMHMIRPYNWNDDENFKTVEF